MQLLFETFILCILDMYHKCHIDRYDARNIPVKDLYGMSFIRVTDALIGFNQGPADVY